MKVNELELHDKFRFKGHHYTIMKAVPRHKDVWDCMDEEGRHVPFRGDVVVEEDQRRITEVATFGQFMVDGETDDVERTITHT